MIEMNFFLRSFRINLKIVYILKNTDKKIVFHFSYERCFWLGTRQFLAWLLYVEHSGVSKAKKSIREKGS